MDKIVGVQFQKNGKLYYFDTNGFDVKPGEYVIVDTARGHDLGEVVLGPRDADSENWHSALKKTIRIATEQDIQHGIENRQKEKEAFSICQKKIAEHKLEMKLVSVEYAFDNSKILFFFTANGRVDFRSLVKDLASIFKMRIELRQIGVRDEAKMLGGLGPCGRPICCGTFLEQFQPVSIKMAKEQNLSLNPTKISGVCGRLMCCLKYEQEHYELTRKKMPKIGREVTTPDGTGSVTDLNIVKETVFVRLTNGDTTEIREYPLEQITRNHDLQPHSEQNKKATDKEPDNHDQPGIDKNTKEEYLDETTDPSDFPDESIKDTDDRRAVAGKEKNKPKHRKGVLGQPVKRENPNRTDGQAKAQVQSGSNPVQVSEKRKDPDTGAEQKNSWADALQKAMQAINQQ